MLERIYVSLCCLSHLLARNFNTHILEHAKSLAQYDKESVQFFDEFILFESWCIYIIKYLEVFTLHSSKFKLIQACLNLFCKMMEELCLFVVHSDIFANSVYLLNDLMGFFFLPSRLHVLSFLYSQLSEARV